jgi:hypothetical protein
MGLNCWSRKCLCDFNNLNDVIFEYRIYCWGAFFDSLNSQLFFKIYSIYIIMKFRRVLNL